MNTLAKLNDIAHLPTDVYFDAEKVLQELHALPFEMNPFKSGFRFGQYIKVHDRDDNWDSIALYSINGDVVPDPEEPWSGIFNPTIAIENCPYLKSVIQSLGGGKLLARFENIKPRSSVGWHGHVTEAGQPDWICIVQMPLSIPPDSKYSVINSMDYRLSDHVEPIPQYDSTYENGRVYIFNGYHYHNAFNYSDEPMYMIRFYVDTREQGVKQFLEKQIQGYSGPYIPTYEEYMESFLTK